MASTLLRHPLCLQAALSAATHEQGASVNTRRGVRRDIGCRCAAVFGASGGGGVTGGTGPVKRQEGWAGPGWLGVKTLERPAGLLNKSCAMAERTKQRESGRELQRAANTAARRISPRLPADSFPACIK